ncbi:MAG: serine/threonine protein kinase [Lachnospiraceae bacterium]|nr:serine/threonine protein kinase [Lachnospiraceae bacterium]
MISLLYIYRLIYTISTVVSEKRKEDFYILDRYRIINQICAHEHSTVWLAEHRTLHAKRIIKGIRRSGPAHDILAAEASTLMSLSHPGIPSVFDVDEDGEYTYIIEEFIEGENLKAFYKKRNVGEEQLLDHLEQICSILEYLQDRSIRLIRLDIKPENIIVSDRIRIIDFGTAQREGERTAFGFMTSGYTAPEYIRGEKSGKEGDVYSLGKLITFMTENSNASKKTRKRLEVIARKCTKEVQRDRVGSGVIVTKMIRRAAKEKRRSYRETKTLTRAKRIAVMGLSGGCGTTYIAVSLASTLAAFGPVRFVQRKHNEALEEIFAQKAKGRQGKGVFYATCGMTAGNMREFTGAEPMLGEVSNYRIVADLGGDPAGVFKEAVAGFDMVLIVGAGALWRRDDYDFLERMAKERLLGPNCRVLINMPCSEAAQLLPSTVKAFCFPHVDNPFSPGSATKKLFGKIVGRS